MKILIVYTHPNPKSFNHAILEAVKTSLCSSGHELKVKDLYQNPLKAGLDAADFEEILSGKVPKDIRPEQADVAWAEGLVFIYPVWWFDRPALLKGWIDRVFLKGFAYDFSPKGPVGLLKHKKALVLVTTGGAEEDYKRGGFKDTVLNPMTLGTLGFCGIPEVASKVFYAVPTVADRERKVMLEEAASFSKDFFK